MSRVLALALLGGAVWYAYREGLIDLEALSAAVAPATDKPPAVAPEIDKRGRVLQPTSGQAPRGTNERRILDDNARWVSGWSRQNIEFTEAIMWQESRGDPSALGPVITSGMHKGDRAHGAMQVMPLTAVDIYERGGYRLLAPEPSILRTAAGSVYFGTAYLEMLARHGRDLRWIAHAYNGGPGWAALTPGSANYQQNQNYAAQVMRRYQQLTTGELV